MGSQLRKIAHRMDRDEFKMRNTDAVKKAGAQGAVYPKATSPGKLRKKIERLMLKRSAYARFVTCILLRAVGHEAEPVLVNRKIATPFQQKAASAKIVALGFSPSVGA